MDSVTKQSLSQRIADYVRSLSRGQKSFYIAFALCAFATLMSRTTFVSVLGITKDLFVVLAYGISAFLLLLKLLFEREKSWRFAFALILVVVAIISYWVADAWRFSVLFLFIAAGKDISIRGLAAIALALQLIVLVPTLCFALSGHISSFTVNRLVDGVWMSRSSYGYSHPNMLGQVFLVIAASYAALRFPRFYGADLLVYTGAALAAALLVWSRTATIAIVLVAVLAVCAPRIVQSRQGMRTAALAALLGFCVLAAFSLGMMAWYNPDVPWMNTIDSILSKRFTMAHRFFEVFPPQPFGREYMAVKVDDFLQEAPDNAYARALLKQGIIPAFLLGALVFAALLRYVWRAVWDACTAGLLVYAVVGLMEMYATNFTLNYFLIACAWALWASWGKQYKLDARLGYPSKKDVE